jgi:hypothetical protein
MQAARETDHNNRDPGADRLLQPSPLCPIPFSSTHSPRYRIQLHCFTFLNLNFEAGVSTDPIYSPLLLHVRYSQRSQEVLSCLPFDLFS